MTRDEMIETMAEAANPIAWENLGEGMTARFKERRRARLALSVLEAAGYVVVPKELTPEMWDAAEAAYQSPAAMWTAMLSAAQQEKTDG